MASYLSNYDPSAFNAGLAWAAQRQAAREAVVRQAQEAEARKAQIEQEGEIQRRNQAAAEAMRYQHEAEQTKQKSRLDWGKSRLEQSIGDITAEYNRAAELMPGAANQADFQKYMDGLNHMAATVRAKKPEDDMNSAELTPPPPPLRQASKEELAEADAAIQGIKDKHNLTVAQAANAWAGVSLKRAQTAKAVVAASNPATKLSPTDRKVADGFSKALGAQREYEAYAPKIYKKDSNGNLIHGPQNGLVLDNPRDRDYLEKLGTNPDLIFDAQKRFGANSYFLLEGARRAAENPVFAESVGLTPNAAKLMLKMAPSFGNYTKNSQVQELKARAIDPRQKYEEGFSLTDGQVLFNALNSNPYAAPVESAPPQSSDNGGDD